MMIVSILSRIACFILGEDMDDERYSVQLPHYVLGWLLMLGIVCGGVIIFVM